MAQRIRLKKEPSLEAKFGAFSFQAEAVRAVRDLEYCAVFHEQGLGKSKIAIDLMLYWLERKLVDTVLFVVKKGLLANWEKEFRTHTHMRPKVLSQNRKENYYIFNSPSRLILTHYEVLKSERERFQLFLKARNVAVILDESTRIKNPYSALTRTIFELAPLFRRRVIMTGTSIANRPYDIWSQIWFLDEGKSLGSDFKAFKEEADLANELAHNADARSRFETFIGSLSAKISHFTVRKTKETGTIVLPRKEIHSVLTDWERRQYDLYHQIQSDMRAVVIKDGLPTEDNSEEMLKRLLRLVQIASNPRLVDESYDSQPGKLIFLKDILDRIVQSREKCIVWSTFTGNIDWLAQELSAYGVRKVHGSLTFAERNRAIERFVSDPDIAILFATPGAAKEGLTLTVANHVIFFDRSFSLDDYLQAQDRIHRISQSKICHVYNLIMRESVDEWIELLLHAKSLAARLAQGDISLDYYQAQMSYDFGTIVRGILGVK
ncbi:MAG: DEAD/DEAH box helicase [Phycisphaerae bacterium]|nr:DEAD/DEAH box helicase [Phycisphaerae bacterium]